MTDRRPFAQRPLAWASLACALAIFAFDTPAQSPLEDTAEEIRRRIGSGNPEAGKAKSEAELCQGCHGSDGNADAVGVPKLAGQYAAYLLKQLQDFRSQARRHRIMNAMAEGPGEDDLKDIAAFFASLPRMRSEDPSTPAPSQARELFLYGDGERNLDACVNCHGLEGRGRLSRDQVYPAIAGQHEGYLRVQLLNWKIGARSNSTNGVMNRIGAALSEGEIAALAAYLAGM